MQDDILYLAARYAGEIRNKIARYGLSHRIFIADCISHCCSSGIIEIAKLPFYDFYHKARHILYGLYNGHRNIAIKYLEKENIILRFVDNIFENSDKNDANYERNLDNVYLSLSKTISLALTTEYFLNFQDCIRSSGLRKSRNDAIPDVYDMRLEIALMLEDLANIERNQMPNLYNQIKMRVCSMQMSIHDILCNAGLSNAKNLLDKAECLLHRYDDCANFINIYSLNPLLIDDINLKSTKINLNIKNDEYILYSAIHQPLTSTSIMVLYIIYDLCGNQLLKEEIRHKIEIYMQNNKFKDERLTLSENDLANLYSIFERYNRMPNDIRILLHSEAKYILSRKSYIMPPIWRHIFAAINESIAYSLYHYRDKSATLFYQSTGISSFSSSYSDNTSVNNQIHSDIQRLVSEQKIEAPYKATKIIYICGGQQKKQYIVDQRENIEVSFLDIKNSADRKIIQAECKKLLHHLSSIILRSATAIHDGEMLRKIAGEINEGMIDITRIRKQLFSCCLYINSNLDGKMNKDCHDSLVNLRFFCIYLLFMGLNALSILNNKYKINYKKLCYFMKILSEGINAFARMNIDSISRNFTQYSLIAFYAKRSDEGEISDYERIVKKMIDAIIHLRLPSNTNNLRHDILDHRSSNAFYNRSFFRRCTDYIRKLILSL